MGISVNVEVTLFTPGPEILVGCNDTGSLIGNSSQFLIKEFPAAGGYTQGFVIRRTVSSSKGDKESVFMEKIHIVPQYLNIIPVRYELDTMDMVSNEFIMQDLFACLIFRTTAGLIIQKDTVTGDAPCIDDNLEYLGYRKKGVAVLKHVSPAT